MFYVYVYLDPRKPGVYKYGKYEFKHEPFYVGKGKIGDHRHRTYKRYADHLDYAKRNNLCKSSNPHKFYKIRKILSCQKEPIIIIIKEFGLEDLALNFETHLISLIGRSDLKKGPLTNLTDGGDGCRGCRGLSMKTRMKISASLKGKKFFNPGHFKKGQKPSNYGIKMLDSMKKRISKTLQMKYASSIGNGMRKECSKGRKGKKNTVESNIRRSQKLTERYENGSFTGMKGKRAYNKNKTTYPSKIVQYSKDGFFLNVWDSLGQIRDQLGINASNISQCINNKRETAGGYKWGLKKVPLSVAVTVS